MKYIIIIIMMIHCVIFAHYKPMIDEQYPKPPPKVDPGPDAALVRAWIIDVETNEIASATVCVNDGAQEPDHDPYHKFSLRKSANRHKGPMRFRPVKYYFYTDGQFEVRVPPGKVTLEIMKGYEYQPSFIQLDIPEKDTVDLKIHLEKSIDMASMGWYSGDIHIHMDRTGTNDDTLLTITSAKNIKYAYLLSMNTKGYDKGSKYESWLQKKGLGERSITRKGPYFIVSGQEYRTNILGHVLILMSDDYVDGIGINDDITLWPSLSLIADQAHEKNGFIGLSHGGYHLQEADGLLLDDKMDFLELLQFGGYRSLGLDGWYDFLNIGFRLPMVGACDFPYTRELGSEITYVWSDSIPTCRSFMQGIAEGKSFATTGPMLFLEVEAKKPGEIFHFPANTDTMLRVRINVQSPVYPVRNAELIVDGQVVRKQQFDELKNSWQFHHRLRITKSCWIAARTYAEAGTEAHTNPVYVYVDNQLPFNRDCARHIIARLEGSIETIPNKKLTKRLLSLKKEIIKMLEGKKSGLPFPDVIK
jgi:hypothetical protein